ncbi:MAG: hypothetical protein ACREC5_05245 [Thermoplasmata archaeon]
MGTRRARHPFLGTFLPLGFLGFVLLVLFALPWSAWGWADLGAGEGGANPSAREILRRRYARRDHQGAANR